MAKDTEQQKPFYSHLNIGDSPAQAEFFDFPINVYDRPSLALGNLLKGRVDAATKAIFSPMNLTPAELTTVRTELLKGTKRPNIILKTAIDVATNPFMIIGLVMALGPWGKIASAAGIGNMIKEGGSAMADIFPSHIARKLASPLTSFRSLWNKGFLKHVGRLLDHTSRYNAEGLDALRKAALTYTKESGKGLSVLDQTMVAAWRAGWHKHTNAVTRHWPSVRDALGGRALIPDLERRMGPALLKYAKAQKNIIDDYYKMLVTPSNWKEISDEMIRKGIQVSDDIPFVSDYFEQITVGLPPELRFGAGGKLDLRQYEFMIRRAATGGRISGRLKPRKGFSLPDTEALDTLREMMDPRAYEMLHHGIAGRRVTELKEMLTNATNGIRGMLSHDPQGAMARAKLFVQKTLQERSHGIGARLAAAGLDDAAADRLANQLIGAAASDYGNMSQVIDEVARLIGEPVRYSMRSFETSQQYIRAMAPTYGWYASGSAKPLAAIRTTFMDEWQSSMWDQELLPTLRGFMHPKEYARRLSFKATKQRFWQWLETSPVAKKHIPPDAHKWLLSKFGAGRGSITENTFAGMLSKTYYTSALGMNLSPTSKNLLQNYITTLPWLGAKNMALGAGRVGGGLKKLAKLMSGKKGLKFADAFQEAFPEYAKIFGHEAIMESMLAGDIAKEGMAAGRLSGIISRRGAHAVSKAMMAPFAGSEKFNRLLAFYSGLEGGLAGGMLADDAIELGRFITMATQFTGGPFGIPNVLRGSSPLVRQFMHFPLRFMEYLYQSFRMGPQGAFTLGPLGRGLMASTGAYTVAKNLLKTDISSGLMFSALPVPAYEGAPFYPFPMVPPFVGVMGTAGKALLTGEMGPGNLGQMLAIHVPGGLAARRMIRAWRPKHAAYNQRTADGRIPLYNDEGFLEGSYRPMELVMRGLGLHNIGPAGERQMTEYLLKQRDRIRRFRRHYLEAIMQNDLERAGTLNQKFMADYPSLGPLTVKKSDITAVQNRKTMSRLNRVLQGFPAEYRPLFQSMVSQAGLAQIAQDAETDISSLEHYVGLRLVD